MTHAPTPTGGTRIVQRTTFVFGVVAVLAMTLLFVFPVTQVFTRFDLATLRELSGSGRIRRIAWFSAWQAVLSTIVVLLLAVPLAGTLAGRTGKGSRWLLAFVAAPFTLPTVVVAAAFREVLPRSLESGVTAIISAHVFYNVGMATLIIAPRFELIDNALSQAAATLGSSRIRIARAITLPLIRPAVIGAALLTFTLCFTSFGVVLMLGGSHRTTIDVEIYQQALQRSRFDRASALAVLQFAVLAALAYVASRTRTTQLSHRAARNARSRRSGDGSVVRTLFIGSMVAAVSTPLLALVRRSFQEASGAYGFGNFRALARTTRGSGLLGSPLDAFVVSGRSALLASLLALAIGAGIAVAAQEIVRLRTTLRLFASLPLATSSVQLGLGFLLAFAAAPFAWRSRWFAVPLVQAVVAVPFVVRQLTPVLDGVGRDLRNAAMTLGAKPWKAWRTIDLALARPAFASAFAIAAAISLGEFGAATFLARPDGPTVPVAISRLSGRPGALVQGQAAALATLLGLATFAVVIAGRTLGASGRRSSRNSTVRDDA